jgi:serine/threonine protein phosphatase 1
LIGWKLPKSLRAREPARGPTVPPGYRIYAVGDIHGELGLLDQLIDRIERDVAERKPKRCVLVFLGDLIDRGPDSAAVVERLRTYRHPAVRTVFISGNHEEVLLRILAGEDSLVPSWLRFGGLECATSYGLGPDLPTLPQDVAGSRIRSAVPEAHRTFLDGFVDSFRAGDYLFVHAGVRPGLPLDRQVPEDLRWIRSPFLEWPGPHEAMIVHGHTISSEIEELPGRIGIDTGAYRHGKLTAVALERADRWYLQADHSSPGGIGGEGVLAYGSGSADVPVVGA